MPLDSFASTPQPPPTGEGVVIADLVIADLEARREAGVRKYGTPLRANNGRDALVDAYQEALDLAVYLRQAIEDGQTNSPKLDELFQCIREELNYQYWRLDRSGSDAFAQVLKWIDKLKRGEKLIEGKR